VLKELFSSRYNARVHLAPYLDSLLLKYNQKLGDRKTDRYYQKDIVIANSDHSIAWQHRRAPEGDIYFFSNQKNAPQQLDLILRGEDYLGDWDYYLHREKRMPEIWNPLTGAVHSLYDWEKEGSNFRCSLDLSPNESVFVIFRKDKPKEQFGNFRTSSVRHHTIIKTAWEVQFDTTFGGPKQPILIDSFNSWTKNEDPRIRYYSGTAIYSTTFALTEKFKDVSLTIDSIYNIATVKVNGKIARILWTPPYDLNITSLVRNGKNTIQIEVTNTWANRLIGDNLLPVDKRGTWTTAPFRLSGKPLLPAGLVGNVEISITR
jgi:hypothetical protein